MHYCGQHQWKFLQGTDFSISAVQTHFRPDKHCNKSWKITSSANTECNLMARLSVQAPCERCNPTFPICGCRYSINWWYVLGNTLKYENCPVCSCVILVCFSSFSCVAIVLLNFKAQQRGGSLYGQALPLILSRFYKVKETNIILAVDLVGTDIWILLMTIIHFSPRHQLSGDKKLAMASCCKHLRPMEKRSAKNQFWKDDLVEFGSSDGQGLCAQSKLSGTREQYKVLGF